MLISGILYNDFIFIYIVKQSLPYVTIQNCNITDLIPWAVCYIPTAYFFYNWRFYLLIPFNYFTKDPFPLFW